MKNAIFKRYTAALCLLALAPTIVTSAEQHAKHGQDLPADQRHAIPLDSHEKNFLLSEMREFLAATQLILSASQAGDMPAVMQAARSVGLKAHRDDFSNPDSIVHKIRKKAPKEFLPLGKATHAGFDDIADIAQEIGDKDVVNKLLADNLRHCVACHAAYRITDSH
jgi:hypothetical protein